MTWKVTNSQDYAPKYVRYLINTEAVTPGTVDYNFGILAGTVDIDWGDGTSDTAVNTNTTHTYSSPDYYVVTISQNGTSTFRPDIGLQEISVEHESVEGGGFWDNNMTSAAQNASNLVRWGSVDLGNVTNFTSVWRGCSSLTSFPLIDTSGATNFQNTWLLCSKLTSFPLIDTSSATNFASTWDGCSNLTSFPLINTSLVTNFNQTWDVCSQLTSFPLINTSSGTIFTACWRSNQNLTSFPAIDTSSATDLRLAWDDCNQLASFPLLACSNVRTFNGAWQRCSSLTDFPANFFDSWAPSVINNSCFVDAWNGCSSLTATSVENILNSIDTSGQSAPASGVDITIDYNASSGTPNISTAVTNLKTRGWTITLNGVAQ